MSDAIKIEETINFNEICRGCMGKMSVMRPIFGTSLDSMLKSVANVEVQINDGLPSQMCVQCVLQVSRAFTFKRCVERTDSTLRVYMAQSQEQEQQIEEVVDETSTIEEPITMDIDSSNCVLILQSSENDSSSNYVVSTLEPLDQHQQYFSNEPDITIDLSEADKYSIDATQIEFQDEIIATDNYESIETYSEVDNEIPLLVSVKTDVYFICEDCGFDCDTEVELNTHKITCPGAQASVPPSYDESDGFKCNVCNKRFAAARILKRHSKTHLVYKPHVCKTCGMSFAESSNLTKHTKKHTGELRNVQGKPHLCSVCGKRFKWSSSLSKHMKHHTKSKLFVCKYCPKYYVEARSLSIHMRSHTGEKPFSCSFCNKTFTQKCNLEKHERVHTGEKPFQCPICGKSFSQSGYVVIHIRTHSKERPYVCNECPKQFSASNSLNIHKRIHSGLKPYVCEVCDRRFARHETLIIHKRTHTGEKPHGCHLCAARFVSSGNLSSHLKTHDSYVYQCSVCCKTFTNNNSLKCHMKIHNKTKEKTKVSEVKQEVVEENNQKVEMSTFTVEEVKINLADDNIKLFTNDEFNSANNA